MTSNSRTPAGASTAPLPAHELVVAALPGAGWHAEFEIVGDQTDQAPILAWLVHADGGLEPVVLDAAGVAEDPREIVNFTRLVPPAAAAVVPTEDAPA
ncbi:hypothetical protein HFP71_16910 [Streptomyces sp. ARC32]